MGIPVQLYHEHSVGICDAVANKNGQVGTTRPTTALTRRLSARSLSLGRDWRLQRVQLSQNTNLLSSSSNKRSDGAFWCFWRENGTGVGIVDDSGSIVNTGDLRTTLATNFLSMDAVDSSSVVFGSQQGHHGLFNLQTGSVRYNPAVLTQPVSHMWHRGTGRSSQMIAFSKADASISVTDLRNWTTCMVSLRISSQYHALDADLNPDATLVAMHNGKSAYLWDLTWPNKPDGIPGLFLEDDEQIVTLKFATTSDSLLIATTHRLLIYEPGSRAALICHVRKEAFYDFFDHDTKIVVEQQHLYGTHIACFAVDELTSRWAPVGYADVRAQFGIHKVYKFYALRSRLHLVADSGNYCQLATADVPQAV
ncbi:LANO_0E04236g1_1 [Lachancea nothofagi CBS 11611]|uniref:LANO_0E04236g1_1 n=1 Tax=Lachancea nothofagi CBS 11611 TaxID=1266666 RepID=A0A1G4JRW9_9SACH|nr:LANO_0E04236g1_1 [Lachancea nothofagi CBS 11611]